MQITRKALLANLSSLLDFIEGACRRIGLADSERFALKLAVGEACANVICHGYAPGSSGPITLIFRAGPEEVAVDIIDRAPPFHPDQAPTFAADADWAGQTVGGLGWHLIRRVTNRIDYQANPAGGNRLTLIRKRSAPLSDF